MGRLFLAACVAVAVHVLLFVTNISWVLPKITHPKWGSRPIVMALEAVHVPSPGKSVKLGRREMNRPSEMPKILRHKGVVNLTETKKTSHAKRSKPRTDLIRKKHDQPLKRAVAKVVKRREIHPVQERVQVSRQLNKPAQDIVEHKAAQTSAEQISEQSGTRAGVRDDALAKVQGQQVASLSPGTSKQDLVVKARPAYLENPPPPYPAVARRRGYQGAVILEVLVSKNGAVKDIRVFKSSGYKVLDRTAVRTVKKWIFEPGKKGNKPIEMWVRVPIRFVLR